MDPKKRESPAKIAVASSNSYGWLNVLDGNHHHPWPANRRE